MVTFRQSSYNLQDPSMKNVVPKGIVRLILIGGALGVLATTSSSAQESSFNTGYGTKSQKKKKAKPLGFQFESQEFDFDANAWVIQLRPDKLITTKAKTVDCDIEKLAIPWAFMKNPPAMNPAGFSVTKAGTFIAVGDHCDKDAP